MDHAAAQQPAAPAAGVEHLSRGIADLSAWIDAANAGRDPEALTWSRLAKITEEAGEVVSAYIGATGQNPRKGVTHTEEDVQGELLDVAITALAALEHLRGHDGASVRLMGEKLTATLERAGLRQAPWRATPVIPEDAGTPPQRRRIRLMVDYSADWPLWENSTETWDVGYNVSPELYGLSPKLSERLMAWNQLFQENMDPVAGWESAQLRELWRAMGQRLLVQLRAEVAHFADVDYEPWPLPEEEQERG